MQKIHALFPFLYIKITNCEHFWALVGSFFKPSMYVHVDACIPVCAHTHMGACMWLLGIISLTVSFWNCSQVSSLGGKSSSEPLNLHIIIVFCDLFFFSRLAGLPNILLPSFLPLPLLPSSLSPSLPPFFLCVFEIVGNLFLYLKVNGKPLLIDSAF